MDSSDYQIEQIYCDLPYKKYEVRFDVERFGIVGDLIVPINDGRHPLIVFVWGSGPAGRHLVGKPSQLMTQFLRAGYAVFLMDKPGTGASTGAYSQEKLLPERAAVLTKTLEILRTHSAVDPQQVGVYGSSQAAYVMAMAVENGAQVDFMLAVSCPAEDSVCQSAYLVEKYLLCAGYDLQTVAQARDFYVQRGYAKTYPEYWEAAVFLDDLEEVREYLGWGGVLAPEDFSPRDTDCAEFYNPAEVFDCYRMPLLAVFAEKDQQINPVQGAAAYRKALECCGHPLSEVVVIPNADHNMRQTETGCLQEQSETYGKPGMAGYHPAFLDALHTWLVKRKTASL